MREIEKRRCKERSFF